MRVLSSKSQRSSAKHFAHLFTDKSTAIAESYGILYTILIFHGENRYFLSQMYMIHAKLQRFSALFILLVGLCCSTITPAWGALPGEDSIAGTPTQNDELTQFNNAAERITEQAALGDELALLPGPNLSLNDFMATIITVASQLAASVAILILIVASFAAISGSEAARNMLKTRIIKILIGLSLIYFSYWIVSLIMGLIWAGS